MPVRYLAAVKANQVDELGVCWEVRVEPYLQGVPIIGHEDSEAAMGDLHHSFPDVCYG